MIRPNDMLRLNLTKIIYCLCLLSFVLNAVPLLAAQKTQNDKRATADRLAAEAMQLIKEGTKEALEQAISKLLAAAPLYRAVADKGQEADTLNSVGTLYSNLGERQQALTYFAEALPLYRAVGDRGGEAVELHNIGSVYAALGETQKALDNFGQALPLLRAVGDRNGEATTLNSIGGLYFTLGEKQKALDYFKESLPLHHAAGDQEGEATTLTNMGSVYLSLEEKEKALGFYERALPLYRTAGDRRSEAVTLNYIGQIYGDTGDLKKAVEFYAQSLPISRAIGDRSGEALTLGNVGASFLALGEQQEALETYEQVLALYHAIGDRSGEARTLFNIAFNERGLGNFKGAIAHMEDAFTILESLRSDIGSQELRSSFFATVQDFYEFYIDLLMQMHKQKPSEGYDARALQASERGRARSLLEMLAEAGADIRQGVDPALLESERDLRQKLNEAGGEQVRILGGQHAEEDAAAIAKELEALTTEFEQVEARIRQSSPRYAALTQPQPLSAREIQRQSLDENTLLLEYSLGRDRSYLWAVTQDSIKSYELPKRADIEDAARLLYESLSDTEKWSGGAQGKSANRELFASGKSKPETTASAAETPPAAMLLSKMVLGPVANQLGGKRLLIVADGALQFIPFAALPIPSAPTDDANTYRPLALEHEIVSLPSASTLALIRREMSARKPAGKTIAMLADPVFTLNDARFTSAGNAGARQNVSTPARGEQRGLALVVTKAATDSGLKGASAYIPRLPGTRKEAERILSLIPEQEQMHAFDFAANRAAIADPGFGQYRYVHFATHGFLNSQHPELSGILLSMYDQQGGQQDGFLRVHEVFNLKLSAELVTLSACQTGLGKEVRGEGLVGMTRGFMYAGSPRVVVSLWSVSDEGTAELMARFYRGMLKDGMRPAAALQAAQISMIKEQKFASPFYWAAFTLQGEWR
jgi:CHAT domain-containing protein/tetratricopeptide (TPR) repeat protein